MRAPFQILVFPFIKEKDEYLYAVFKRKDMDIWQGIAGGGEGNEKPLESAKRESYEEANIDSKSKFIRLSSITTIPAENIHGSIWGDRIIMIPEFSYGVRLQSKKITLGNEHSEFQWMTAEDAIKKLKYDSNKSAIWELNNRLMCNSLLNIDDNIQSIKEYL